MRDLRLRILRFAVLFMGMGIAVSSCRKEDPPPPGPEPPGGNYKIVAYLPGWGAVDFNAIPVDHLTHISYAFANIREGKIYSELDNDSLYLTNLVKLTNSNPDLNILISVGGATWSGEFSDMALTDSSRSVFTNSVLNFINKYKLDGVDLDWEFPGSSLAGTYRPEDKENFTFLLQKLRTQLDSMSAADMRTQSKPYLLTIASGASSWFTGLIEMDKVTPLLDFYNVMNYDYMGSWNSTTGHHTNLYPSNFDPGSKFSTSISVGIYLAKGVPREKIIVGAAFYGRWWSGVTAQNNGLYQSYTGGAGALSYRAIKTGYISDPDFHRYWDPEAKAPYLWSQKDKIFITYDDVFSIKQKSTFVKEEKLGGLMFWEYTQDYNSELMNAVIWGFQ